MRGHQLQQQQLKISSLQTVVWILRFFSEQPQRVVQNRSFI